LGSGLQLHKFRYRVALESKSADEDLKLHWP
jgi:hypothetical protein